MIYKTKNTKKYLLYFIFDTFLLICRYLTKNCLVGRLGTSLWMFYFCSYLQASYRNVLFLKKFFSNFSCLSEYLSTWYILICWLIWINTYPSINFIIFLCDVCVSLKHDCEKCMSEWKNAGLCLPVKKICIFI